MLTTYKPSGLLLLLAILSSTSVIATPNPATQCDSIIVKFNDQKKLSFDPPTQQQLFHVQMATENNAAHYKHTLGNGSHLISASRSSSAQAIAKLNQDPSVEYAECNTRQHSMAAQNDTDYANQWYLFEAAGGINAEDAWDTETGDAATVIAVVDTGIRTHSDITRILPGYDFISDIATANDSDGRDTDPSDPGDFISNAENTAPGGPFENCGESDSSWHGTFVSGIALANAGNNAAIAGIDHAGQLLPVRVLGKCGGFIADISDGIRWAAGLTVPGVPPNMNPANIINLSLGIEESCSNTQQSAINAAVTAGAIVIVAAGNEGSLASNFSPANCDNVLVVAASTRQGGETCYTNIDDAVDLSAPGGNDNDVANGCTAAAGDGLYSTSNAGITTFAVAGNERYGIGTSFATPMVSGAAALIKALAPTYTPQQIRNVLIGSTRNFPTGTTDSFRDCTQFNCGSGILDINAALNLVNAGGATIAPASFVFASQNSVARDTQITSNNITVSGTNAWSEVFITDGQYSVNGGTPVSAKSYVKSGDTVNIRLQSSNSNSTSTSATINIGSVTSTFSVTTVAAAPTVTSTSRSSGGGGSFIWLNILLLFSFFKSCGYCKE